jgi:hypothetical protein
MRNFEVNELTVLTPFIASLPFTLRASITFGKQWARSALEYLAEEMRY